MDDLRILIAQINPFIGSLADNLEMAREAMALAGEKKADLVIFPEMSVIGYPPKDLLEKPFFVDAIRGYSEWWAKCSINGPAMIFGSVRKVPHDGAGKRLQNVAHLAVNGKIEATQAKTLLPSYDVFDEDRYFQPADLIGVMKLGNTRIGVSICEDIWNDKEFWSEDRLYDVDPLEVLCRAENPDILVNISASPYSIGKQATKAKMLAHAAARFGKPLIYVNQAGGNDDVLYDGRSMAFDMNGGKIGELAAFEKDHRMVIVRADTTICLQVSNKTRPHSETAEIFGALVMGIKDYVAKCGFKKAVIGLSGGIDSAVTCALAVEALGPDNVLGISMPSKFSSDHSREDAWVLAKNLGVQLEIHYITGIYDAFFTEFGPKDEKEPEAVDVALENVQARIRGALLMAYSNRYGRLLLTTGNKSEVAVGYCTLYGDTCGGLAVLSDVFKTKVYDLARYVNQRAEKELIPQNTIDKPPSAELRPDQKDIDSLPDYEFLDEVLRLYIEEQASAEDIIKLVDVGETSEAEIRRVCLMVDRNEYKRKQLAPGLRITKKAFGSGRVMPIAHGWR